LSHLPLELYQGDNSPRKHLLWKHLRGRHSLLLQKIKHGAQTDKKS
jgi:hypothetical protein